MIGTLSGFIIAFLAEPVKVYFSNRNNKNQLRESLYREMCLLYNGLRSHSGDIRTKREIVSGFNCYNYAKSDKAVLLFYQFKEAANIDYIYDRFRFTLSDEVSDRDRYSRMKAAIEIFNMIAAEGGLNKRLLQKVVWNANKMES